MNKNETSIGEWHSLGGAPVSGGDDDRVIERGGGIPLLAAKLDFLGLDRDAFVERLTEDAPEKLPNYETVIAVNTGKEIVEDEGETTELELGPNNCAA